MTDLRLFDLNLLVAFDALMTERNVTRAAQRIRIGQPAMSYALSRLRDLFGDELFMRASGTMQPTPRALELAGPIGGILADIRSSIWADRTFRPEIAETVFHMGATDYAEVAVLPDVLALVRSVAPNVRLVVTAIGDDRVTTMLESGTIDVAIGYFPGPGDAHRGEVLFHEEFDCLYDANACGVTAPLSLATYLKLPHIVMSLCEELTVGIDAALTQRALDRFVVLTTPHFLTIPFLLRGLAAVAAVPRRLARNCAIFAGLEVSPMPFPMNGFEVSMRWHQRTETDPANSWLRRLVRDVARSKR
ncbi:LysR family transcriptional regulator [Afipia sp. GAS231]|uniref:LysR family transcriptional regulator n=1 Tax=Afipia sp. GAS231 TaxID=1882747 RepID=UPI00087AA318|nr:LysR family transcriptional regulator [Afipia sp. GAS231]SDN77352.1 transcriptional regulator, LysR family [Afipia sp. GAS231]